MAGFDVKWSKLKQKREFYVHLTGAALSEFERCSGNTAPSLSRARNLIMCCPGANGSAHYCSTVCMADLPPSLYSIAVVALIWKRLISCCSLCLDYALFLSFLNKTSTSLEEKGGPIGAHRRGSCRFGSAVAAPASRMVDFG